MVQRLEGVNLRPAVAGDDPAIVEIYNHHEYGSVPLTVARYRAEYTEESLDHQGERYVATKGDRLVGFSNFHWAWWTGETGIYAVDARVDPSHLRQGIGTGLFDLLRSRLRLRGTSRLVGRVRADSGAGRRFVTRVGLLETGQVIEEYLLNVPEADTSAYLLSESRLLQAGLRIAPLSELPQNDRMFLQALQRLWADSGDESPSPDQLHDSFGTWRQQVLDASGLSPETHWIALQGEQPVGMTFLKRLSADAFDNDYTGVARAYRGRGIATALKLRSIVWAQQQDVQWFCTSSEINNAAMIAINTRLGYRPGVRRLEVACNLTP